MSHETKQRRWVSRGKAAKRFGVTPRTIRRWEQRPELHFPKVRMMNGRGYFEDDELEDHARSQVAVAAARSGAASKIDSGSDADADFNAPAQAEMRDAIERRDGHGRHSTAEGTDVRTS
jgi:hypothetical protein